MIDFSPEAWDRHRRGEFPEGGSAPGAGGQRGTCGGSQGGRTFPDTISTPNSAYHHVAQGSQVLFINLLHEASLDYVLVPPLMQARRVLGETGPTCILAEGS